MSVDDTEAEAEPAPLHSDGSVGLATLFGTCLAGAILIARNFQALGRPDKAYKALACGVLGLAALALIVHFVVLPANAPSIFKPLIHTGQVLLMRRIAVRVNGMNYLIHQLRGGRFHSRWLAVGTGLLVLPVAYGVFFVVAMVIVLLC